MRVINCSIAIKHMLINIKDVSMVIGREHSPANAAFNSMSSMVKSCITK